MRKALALHAIAAAAALAVSGSLVASPEVQKIAQGAPAQRLAQAPVEAKKGDTPGAITYNAPMRGAPATRVGGGTRSAATKSVQLSVLAPSDTGFTTRDKPTIYWYVSETLSKPVELTIISNESLTQEPVSTDVFIINYARASDILPTITSLVPHWGSRPATMRTLRDRSSSQPSFVIPRNATLAVPFPSERGSWKIMNSSGEPIGTPPD